MPTRGSRHHTFRGDGTPQWDTDWADLDAAATAEDTTRSELIRAFIRWYLRRPRAKLPPRPPA